MQIPTLSRDQIEQAKLDSAQLVKLELSIYPFF